MSDLFDFFKEQEGKLHESPTPDAWAKIEARLERKRRQRQRKIRFLQLGLVALTLGMLLFAAWMVWFFARKG
jgi:hypothetical protein